MNLRKLARDRPCMIRVPGVCNHNPETTVLCHIRMPGLSGMGLKVPDLLACWGCSDCHRWCDGEGKTPPEIRHLFLLEAVMRTQAQLIREEVIKW